MRSPSTIEVTTGTVLRSLLLILGFLFLYAIRDIVLIILVAIIIASAVEPLIVWLTRYKIPRVLSVFLIYLTGIVFFVGLFYLVIPPLAGEVQNFFVSLPVLLDSAFSELRAKFPLLPLDAVLPAIRDLTINADITIREALSGAFKTTSALFSGIVAFFLVFVISFYLAVQEDGISNVLRVIVPREHEEYVIGLWKRSQRKIGRWLQGQLLLGVIVGVIVFIALSILQVHYAFLLAVLSAAFELIPYFGPVMAAIPAIAIAAIQKPILGLLVAGIFVLVQQMENHLIYPQVVRKTVGVHPLLAVISLLIGGKLAGLMGLIIAIPIAVVLVEYLSDVENRKKGLIV